MMNRGQLFHLFANCIPVKGANRSIVCDVHRGVFRYIPNVLQEILSNCKSHTVAEVKTLYSHLPAETIDDYFTFLEDNEFIFYCSAEEKLLFPELSRDVDFPSAITNCILDFDPELAYDHKNVFRQLAGMHCNYWQLRFFGSFKPEEMVTILKAASEFPVSIQVVMRYHSALTKMLLLQVYQAAPISQIDFYAVPESKRAKLEKWSAGLPFHFHTAIITDQTHCGKIHPALFSLNMHTFMESQFFNNCLNRKMGVDVKGNIKNCPGMAGNYGNVKDTTLQKALENKAFKYVWSVTKDQVAVCRDCEFRYICTDCRAYRENPKDLYSKPLKCGYDPYTNVWEDWSENPLKRATAEVYGIKIT